MDIEVNATFVGKAKILTMILGIITFAIQASSHESRFNDYKCLDGKKDCIGYDGHKENIFYAISFFSLLLSTLLVLATIFGLTERMGKWRIIDMVYHILMAVLLMVGWALYVMSVSDRAKGYRIGQRDHPERYPEGSMNGYNSFMVQRSFVLIFSGISIGLHVVIAILVFRRGK